MNVVIVGGGPSGVEIAGALAEMKKYLVPRDYPDLADRMHIYLVNSGERLLKAMDKKSSATAEKELVRKGVHVRKGWRVTDYDGRVVRMKNGETIESANVIWVSDPVVKTSETTDLTTFTRPTITCISAFPTKR